MIGVSNVFARQPLKKIGLFCLLIAMMLVAGCKFPWNGQDKGLDAGYYKQVYLLPHGQFVGIEKLKADAVSKGLVYKVEMDEMKRVKDVTAVYNDKPIDANWGLDIAGDTMRFAKVAISYDDSSMTYSFLSANDKKVSWQAGVAAVRFTELNKQGLPGKAEYLNEDMSPVINKGHNLTSEFTYNDYDMLETMKLSGWLRSGEDLQLKFYYDQNFFMHKLPVGLEIMDADGRLRPGFGDVARIVWQYDKQNRLIKKQFLGVDGEPVNNNVSISKLVPEQYWNHYERFCASFDCTYDENNYFPIKITCYGADGELWKSNSTASVVPQPIYKFSYNEAGDLVKVEAEDTEGHAAKLHPNIYAIGYDYDDVGNLKECTFYGDDGKPALTDEKYARMRWAFDTHRRITELSYFGVNDEKVNAAITGEDKVHYYHKFVAEWESDGRLSQILYYNANDKQIK